MIMIHNAKKDKYFISKVYYKQRAKNLSL